MVGGFDLPAAGFSEAEHRIAGRATSYVAVDLPADGRFQVRSGLQADFATRIHVRRPAQEQFNGTVVLEWLNVSGGADGAAGWSFLARRSSEAAAPGSASLTSTSASTAVSSLSGPPGSTSRAWATAIPSATATCTTPGMPTATTCSPRPPICCGSQRVHPWRAHGAAGPGHR